MYSKNKRKDHDLECDEKILNQNLVYQESIFTADSQLNDCSLGLSPINDPNQSKYTQRDCTFVQYEHETI